MPVKDQMTEFYKIYYLGYETNEDGVVRRIHKNVAPKARKQHIGTKRY